jgi:two-component system, NarL family, sensor kinase
VRITLDAGQPTDLPAAVEVAAFRIAVEAVNNAVRHSGAENCEVRLEIDTPGQFVVEVRDDGRGAGPWQAGVGLLAMRERVAELGGTLTVGPGADGGMVRACFPFPVKEVS